MAKWNWPPLFQEHILEATACCMLYAILFWRLLFYVMDVACPQADDWLSALGVLFYCSLQMFSWEHSFLGDKTSFFGRCKYWDCPQQKTHVGPSNWSTADKTGSKYPTWGHIKRGRADHIESFVTEFLTGFSPDSAFKYALSYVVKLLL